MWPWSSSLETPCLNVWCPDCRTGRSTYAYKKQRRTELPATTRWQQAHTYSFYHSFFKLFHLFCKWKGGGGGGVWVITWPHLLWRLEIGLRESVLSYHVSKKQGLKVGQALFLAEPILRIQILPLTTCFVSAFGALWKEKGKAAKSHRKWLKTHRASIKGCTYTTNNGICQFVQRSQHKREKDGSWRRISHAAAFMSYVARLQKENVEEKGEFIVFFIVSASWQCTTGCKLEYTNLNIKPGWSDGERLQKEGYLLQQAQIWVFCLWSTLHSALTSSLTHSMPVCRVWEGVCVWV